MNTTDLHSLVNRYSIFLRVEKNVSEHTLRNYLSDLWQFFAFLEKPPSQSEPQAVAVEANDPHRIHAFLSFLHREHKKSSIGRKLSALKSFFRFLLRENVVQRDPTLHIGSP